MAKATDQVEEKYFGLFTQILCNNLKRKFREHIYLEELIMETHNISLNEVIEKSKTLKDVDDMLTSKIFGYGNADNYYLKARSSNFLHSISTPTLFINALDDPVCGKECIPYNSFSPTSSDLQNNNIALLTTNGGGHVAHFTSIFSSKQWYNLPAFTFFESNHKST
mmetsp:Transcript_2987/g.3535  ORF Transcript_2987/g.3535 Transcript_2987/m.3535 type:complete len:166 (+) Transcript_2987:541-1038(+)